MKIGKISETSIVIEILRTIKLVIKCLKYIGYLPKHLALKEKSYDADLSH